MDWCVCDDRIFQTPDFKQSFQNRYKKIAEENTGLSSVSAMGCGTSRQPRLSRGEFFRD